MRLRRLEPLLRRALLGPCALPTGSALLVAVSGGADSTALLVALHALAPRFGIALRAAHLHHGLRGDGADRDLAAVRALCARLDVPLVAARWDCRARMRREGLSGQGGLRTLRRRFLAAAARRTGAAAIATAHTADDQLETVLLRLARGSGLDGLGGMSPRRGRWIKPLLAATRCEVEADLEAAGVTWCDDASNDDPRYARSRVRHQVIPALLGPTDGDLGRAGQARAGLARRVAATTRELRAARRLVTRLAARIPERVAGIHRQEIRLETTPFGSYARPVQRAALRRCWRRLGTRTGLTARHLDALHSLVVSRVGAMLDLPGGFQAERGRGVLLIRRPAVPARERTSVPKRGHWQRNRVRGSWVDGADARRRMRARRPGEELFAADGIDGRLELRQAHPNEWFVPFGDRKARRLRDFLGKQPVSRALRAHPMVLADTQGILWVVGVRRSARAPLDETTRRALWVHAENR